MFQKNYLEPKYTYTVGRTSIWQAADFTGFPTYKACRSL